MGDNGGQTNTAEVVIVGAGFAGLWAARALAGTPTHVTVIDTRNYHTFTPLLYQVAAAELEPTAIVYPLRSLMRPIPNATFALGSVTGLDLHGRAVLTGARRFEYDYLIVATGSRSTFYHIPGAGEHSFPLKTLEQAIALRTQIICCFEKASCEPDESLQRQHLTFAIVGGGPTGVEFAGALSELIRGPLAKDHPELDAGSARIVLFEAGERLVSAMPARLGDYTLRRLEGMGVEVRLRAKVSEITPEALCLDGGERISTDTVVWTAGVEGELPEEALLPLGRGSRARVLDTLQTEDHPEVYVVGDASFAQADGRPLPMVAPVATQQGAAAARNILRQIGGQDPQAFRYHDRGSMLTLGRNKAAAQVGRFCFTGFPAWVLWLGVHLFNLIGFRNRLLVLMNWAWDYLFYDRPIRLILAPSLGPASETLTATHCVPD